MLGKYVGAYDQIKPLVVADNCGLEWFELKQAPIRGRRVVSLIATQYPDPDDIGGVQARSQGPDHALKAIGLQFALRDDMIAKASDIGSCIEQCSIWPDIECRALPHGHNGVGLRCCVGEGYFNEGFTLGQRSAHQRHMI